MVLFQTPSGVVYFVDATTLIITFSDEGRKEVQIWGRR
jgi:hypothetical protein